MRIRGRWIGGEELAEAITLLALIAYVLLVPWSYYHAVEVSKMKYSEPTCGECHHWTAKTKRSRKGSCTASYPMWVLGACRCEMNSEAMDRDTPAGDCACFVRPEDVPEVAPHYVGQPAPARYEEPGD